MPLFPIENKDRKCHFFKQTFLFADISMDVVFKILFLTLSNVEIEFNNQKFRWRLYIFAKVFFTNRQTEWVRKIVFVIAAFDPEDETFIIYVTSFVIFDVIHLFCRV